MKLLVTRRVASLSIDIIIISIIFFALETLFGTLLYFYDAESKSYLVNANLAIIPILLSIRDVGYFKNIFLGKRLLKVSICKFNGDKASYSKILLRSLAVYFSPYILFIPPLMLVDSLLSVKILHNENTIISALNFIIFICTTIILINIVVILMYKDSSLIDKYLGTKICIGLKANDSSAIPNLTVPIMISLLVSSVLIVFINIKFNIFIHKYANVMAQTYTSKKIIPNIIDDHSSEYSKDRLLDSGKEMFKKQNDAAFIGSFYEYVGEQTDLNKSLGITGSLKKNIKEYIIEKDKVYDDIHMWGGYTIKKNTPFIRIKLLVDRRIYDSVSILNELSRQMTTHIAESYDDIDYIEIKFIRAIRFDISVMGSSCDLSVLLDRKNMKTIRVVKEDVDPSVVHIMRFGYGLSLQPPFISSGSRSLLN
jgi:uncharacterized RDD family membrane protein YckC